MYSPASQKDTPHCWIDALRLPRPSRLPCQPPRMRTPGSRKSGGWVDVEGRVCVCGGVGGVEGTKWRRNDRVYDERLRVKKVKKTR